MKLLPGIKHSPCGGIPLTLRRWLWRAQVVPQEQQLFGSGYKGAVRFNLWRFGRWVVVYVDDLLPTSEDRLIYSRCSDPREFWVALLEKAYAKYVSPSTPLLSKWQE